MLRWSALLVAAILGLSQEARAERVEHTAGAVWQADAFSEFVATTPPAACMVAVERPSLQPSLTEFEGVASSRGWDVTVQSVLDRRADLVAVQVFEKYRAFRESLSTP
jgi:hypothetical protein